MAQLKYPLKIADGLSFPLELVTQAFAVVAKRRVGKSYLGRRVTEQVLHAGQQVIFVDPKGDQWGIRSSADGKGVGLPILILGGERGDVPLEPGSGEVVAKLAVEERVSLLLDLSLFRKHELATFMAAFLETLYRLKAREKYRTPVLLVLDEGDAIAPQKPQPNERRMLGAASDIVRRGGQRGLGCMLITQRSAVLNKDVLTQVEMLICLRTIAPQDLKAIEAWIDVHGTEEQRELLKKSLPSLPIGDAWVWSPGWPTVDGLFTRIHTLPITTFDSGATPKPGQKRFEPAAMAEVDLAALRQRMASTIERHKAEDPRELQKRIATLERELAKAHKATPVQRAAVEPERIMVPTVHPEALKLVSGIVQRSRTLVTFAADAIQYEERKHRDLVAFLEEAKAAMDLMSDVAHAQPTTIPTGPKRSTTMIPTITYTTPEPKRYRDRERRPARTNGKHVPTVDAPAAFGELVLTELKSGQRTILIACAQHDGGSNRAQLKTITGYATSTINRLIAELKALAMVVESGKQIEATAAGIAALGEDYDPLPTGGALLDYWLKTLPQGNATILRLVAAAYPDAIEREALDKEADYAVSTRNRLIHELSARHLVSALGPGKVIASEDLFD